jgi:hypothetical protein
MTRRQERRAGGVSGLGGSGLVAYGLAVWMGGLAARGSVRFAGGDLVPA